MKMDADDKELLDAVERGGWKSAKGGKRGLAVPDADLEPAAQVRIRAAERGVTSDPMRDADLLHAGRSTEPTWRTSTDAFQFF